MECPYCLSQIPQNARVCAYCGREQPRIVGGSDLLWVLVMLPIGIWIFWLIVSGLWAVLKWMVSWL